MDMAQDTRDDHRLAFACERETVHLALIGDQGSRTALDLLARDLADALAAYEHLGFPGRERTFDFIRAPLALDECECACEQRFAAVPEASRLYALSATTERAAQRAAHALEALSEVCGRHGTAWGGGIAIAGGELTALCAAGPRMGRMRRGQSEAIDRLILAIRMHSSLQELPNGPDDGIIAVPSPVPACLYGVALRLYRRS